MHLSCKTLPACLAIDFVEASTKFWLLKIERVYQDSQGIKHVCMFGRAWLNDVIMMGFNAASGLVSVILQVIVDRIVLFCLLFCSAIQTYTCMYRRREYSNSDELNPVQVAFCDSGTIRLFTKHTTGLFLNLGHNTFHLLFIEAEEWH